jgi:ubiquinone/menaquinone biosynthesis C-methylase UbiE
MNYPDYETYRKLYAKYFVHRQARELVDLAGSLTNKTVVDLCGGAGEIALLAKKKGAKTVLLIDGEEAMVDMKALYDFGIWFQRHDLRNWHIKYILRCVNEYEPDWEREECGCFQCETEFDGADFVFCRQAVNYWLWDEKAAKDVARIMRSGGKFIFNTFNTKPSTEPKVKQYDMGNLNGDWSKYVEVHWLVDDMVHHVQICEGMEPHYTSFKWIPPERFREILEPHFDLDIKTDQYTDIYICQKR